MTPFRHMARRQSIPPWTPRVLRVAGIVSLIIGIVIVAYMIAFGIGAKQAIGTVVDIQMGRPVVQFEIENDQFQFSKIRVGSFKVGDKVPVLYRPENPKSATINTFFERWFIPCWIMMCGICWIILAPFVPKIFRFFNASSDTEDSEIAVSDRP